MKMPGVCSGLAVAVSGMALLSGFAEEPIRWTFALKSGQQLAKSGVGTLTDGNWVLNATICDADRHTLWIGDGLWTDESGQTLGNAFTGVGYGTLDLTGRVASSDGGTTTDWTIVSMAAMAFTGPDATLCPAESNGENEYPRSVIMPTTLTEWRYKGFRWNGSMLWVTNLVVRCPDLTGAITIDSMSGHNKGDWRWVLDAPKLTEIGAIATFCIGKSTDFDEWHVEGVANFGGEYTFNSAAARGTLRLPSMSVVPAGRFPLMPNVTGMELGATNALTFIGRNTFSCKSLRRLSLTVAESGLTVEDGAFTFWYNNNSEKTDSRAASIRVLEFPWYAASAEAVERILKYVPNLSGQGADPCVIYASEKFGANRLVVRQPTAAETAPAVAADERVLGVFTDSGGNDKAWVVHRVADKRFSLTVTTDARWPEDGVTALPAAESGNSLVAGETYTFIARPGAGATFDRWEGVEGAAATNPVYTVVVDGDLDLRPVFVHDWTFDFLRDGEGVALSDRYGQIDNGVWKLNVELYTAGELCCGTNRGQTWSGPDGTIWTGTGSGKLDLRGAIRQFVPGPGESVVTNLLKLTRVGSKAFRTSELLTGYAYASSVRLPPTIRYWETNPFRGNKNITELIIDCPELEQSIGIDDLAGLHLDNLVFNVPRIATLDYSEDFRVQQGTDLSTWRLDNVSNFGFSLINESTCHGTLRLPSVTELTMTRDTIGTFWCVLGSTTGYGAENKDKMVFVELGSKARPFTRIGPYCFRGCPGIRGISVMTKQSGLAIDATAFTDDSAGRSTSNIRELTFPFHVPGSATVTKMLSGVPALADQGGDPCIVYGSSGFGAFALAVAPVAADGEPPAVGEEERVLGVFEDANGVRKAWVVHRPCRCAPGFVMVVR